MATGSGIVIVANRGPNDFVWQNGTWVTRTAAGGLVSMLTPLARRASVAWFCCVSEPPDAQEARRGLYTTAADQTDPRLHVVPVPVPATTYHAYYGQISNEVLWMLQHHIIGAQGFAYLDRGRHKAWGRYLEANGRLASAIVRARPEPQAFLIQDYHLYPLPGLLRGTFPTTPILHFTHIPFPGPPVLRLLPQSWRETILHGLLGADVVGLQTPMDVSSFLACCAEFLGLEVEVGNGSVIATDGRQVCVHSYPASVEPRALRRLMRTPAVAAAHARLDADRGELNIIRVDRLDPSKNQQVGFLAFERLLELRPDLQGRVRFLAFMVPSRTDLGVYRAYRDSVYRTIEDINARFAAACGGPPIRVFYTNDRDQALAAMQRCDALLINSLQDGMNLVAKEWAVVAEPPGVLVVSETAGVAAEAADSALRISPLDVEGTARALSEALDMPATERRARHGRLHQRVVRWTARDWLAAQLADLGVDWETPANYDRATSA
ncbi:MAG TPA: trehalose-6-phosphate synthase [Chloroflexota bacterium]|nr:trehalose-6-phosphate synthase [Chloroflexota bacterium]